MLNKILIFLAMLWLAPMPVLAMQEPDAPTYYLFHLENNNGFLFQRDLESTIPYELSYDEVGVGSGDAKGVVFGLKGEILTEFKFQLKSESNEIYVPFFPNIGSVKLYNQGNEIIFDYDMLDVATCDFDGVCGSIPTEDSFGCPSDCKILEQTAVDVSESQEAKSFKYLTILIIFLGVIGFGLLCAIIYLVYKGLRKQI